MSEASGQWIKGCAIGCGGLVVIFVLFMVGMVFSIRSSFDDAHHDREILAEAHGQVDSFTPAVDGTVPPDRIEAFVTVRSALADTRAKVVKVDREMADFEKLAGRDQEPPMRVALPAIARLTRSMLSLPRVFGEIEQTRNRALVEAGMGLGEYTYVFLMAYHGEVVEPTGQAYVFGGSAVNQRIRNDLLGMFRRQLAAAAAELPEDDEWLGALEREVAALDADPQRIPWQDGLPKQIADCFVPYRDGLDATYSVATAEFELLNSTVKGGGLHIEMK